MLNSLRVRLTMWYLIVFGALLVAFSLYVYSQLAADLNREFDRELFHAASVTASYFNEFVERGNEAAGARETVNELRFEELHTAIYREGQLLAATDLQTPRIVAAAGVLARGVDGDHPAIVTDARGGNRMAAVSFREDQSRYVIVLLEPLLELTIQLGRMRKIFFFGIPGALLLAALGGYLLAQKNLQPIVRISEQTRRIGAENLDQRLTISNPRDELGQLATVINDLLARLETSFRVMRDFIADASHELRTPVAIVHGEADVTLSRARTPTEYQESLGVIRKQSARLRVIVNDMLTLARADAGQQRLVWSEMYLDDLVEECCRGAQTMAGAAGVSLTCNCVRDVSFRGDEELLRRMMLNLVDNAIRYTPAGGGVEARLAQESDGAAVIAVADSGIGIPPEMQPRVFDRFFRVAGPDKGGHSGLGLSIVKLAAEAHEGTVELESEPGRGTTFTVRLPRS